MTHSLYNRPKLLIIDKNQFGYVPDPFKWCEHLRYKYDITFISGDHNLPKIELSDIKIKYVHFQRLPYVLRGLLFILTAIVFVYRNPNNNIIIEYFKWCSIIQFFCPWKKIIVDIRTLCVEKDERQRQSSDRQLIKDCGRFKRITAISEGVKNKLGLSGIQLLPLGSDVISDTQKNYNTNIKILYVGTLYNRNIHEMLHGIGLFVQKHPNISITVDIVGDGINGQFDYLKNVIYNNGLKHIVKLHGYIPLTHLKPFFDNCNIGLSYVPITDYYNYQPPTKTFEYIRSGLFCIATATKANSEIINSTNGILIQDTPESVCIGLETFLRLKSNINEQSLRNTLKDNSWENISNILSIGILGTKQPPESDL